MPRKYRPYNAVKIGKQKSALPFSETQKAQIKAWFVDEHISYIAAVERIKKQFGINVSRTWLHNFWHRNCAQLASDAKNPSTGQIWKQNLKPTAMDALTPEQLGEVKRWFLEENVSYKDASAMIGDRFGIKVGYQSVRHYWFREISSLIADPDKMGLIGRPDETGWNLQIRITLFNGKNAFGEAVVSTRLTPLNNLTPSAP